MIQYMNREAWITQNLQNPSFLMSHLRVGDVVCASKLTFSSYLISFLGLFFCGGRIHYRLGRAPLYTDGGGAYANNAKSYLRHVMLCHMFTCLINSHRYFS